jgi:hypothetical protein
VALTSDRLVDMFQKAGVDLDPATAALPNLAQASGVQASASYVAAGTKVSSAVDGHTISGTSKPREASFAPPIWGSKGSSNAADWYELDFGKPTAFDNVKLYFYNDRFVNGGYSEPSVYNVEYWNGSEWVAAEKAYKLPKVPQANLNEVQFPAVTANKLRVMMSHKGTNKTALKEVQVYHTGIIPPVPVNDAPVVTAAVEYDPKLLLQAKLIGTALDDGLPNGQVDVLWSKVSGPGDVVFANAQASSTTATFTAAGTYQLKLEASDGELAANTELTVVVAPLPTTSFVSSWETLGAVNDGLDWPDSNPANGVSAGGIPRYGNWSQQGTQWVEYTWKDPVRLSKASVSWMDDGGGVRVPASWKLQYWDGAKLVDVAEPSSYGLTKNGYNHVQFKAVTTTKLRIVMVSNNASTGILEWKAFAEPPVDLKAVKVPTLVGQKPVLPTTIAQTYADGSVSEGKVTWFPYDEALLQNSGSSFKVSGIVEGSPLQAEATVFVRVTNAVQVTNISDVSVTTEVGVAPVLPQVADVLYNDGSWDNVSNTIAWDAIAPSSYAKPGSFVVEGSIAGNSTKAKAFVTVKGETTGEPATTLSGPETVQDGASFEVTLGVNDADQNMYGQDFLITYDKDKLEWVDTGTVMLNDSFVLAGEAEKDDHIRLITARVKATGAVVNGPLLKLAFKAKDTESGGIANIAITGATVADASGQESELATSVYSVQINGVSKAQLRALIAEAQQAHDAAVEGTKVGQYPAGSKAKLQAAIQAAQAVASASGTTAAQVELALSQLNAALQTFKAAVIVAVPGDVSGDERVSVGDLAIVAAAYGKTSTDPAWEQIKKLDINKDGKIDIEDLSALARLILG